MPDQARPKYYRVGDLECFDVIEMLEMNFNIGNVLKYIWRYREKGGANDLRKAIVYLDREIATLEECRGDS